VYDKLLVNQIEFLQNDLLQCVQT